PPARPIAGGRAMLRWLTAVAVGVVVVAAVVIYLVVGLPRPAGNEGETGTGKDNVAHAAPAVPPVAPPGGAVIPTGPMPLIVIPEARFAAIYRQDVPCQQEGQLQFIGVEVKLQPGETIEQAKRRLVAAGADLEDDLMPIEFGYLVTELERGNPLR